MQIVKGVRISLTIQDIMMHINDLTKQQLLQKFRLLFDRKQIQLNEKIQKNNSEHLLVLQKKMLTLQKKDDMIMKLNSAISSLKKQIDQDQTKINQQLDQLIDIKFRFQHLEKRHSQADSLLRQQKNKRSQLKKQYQKLNNQYKHFQEKHQQQIQYYKKIKEQKTHIEQSTEMLMKNHLKKHELQLESKIKNIKVEYQYKIHEMNLLVNDQKKKNSLKKQKLNQAKVTISNLNRAIEVLNKQIIHQKTKKLKQIQAKKSMIDAQTQTDFGNAFNSISSNQQQVIHKTQIIINEENTIVKIDDNILQKQTQTQEYECKQCLKLKRSIEISLRKTKSSSFDKNPIKIIQFQQRACQTNPQPVIKKIDRTTQTNFIPLGKQEQIKLLNAMKVIKESSYKLINSYKKKYEEIQQLFSQRPPRKEDLRMINQLEKQKIILQFHLIQKQKQVKSKQCIIAQLYKKISQLQVLLDDIKIQKVGLNYQKKIEQNRRPLTVNQFVNSRSNFRKIKLTERVSTIRKSSPAKSTIQQNKSKSYSMEHSSNNSIQFMNERIKTEIKTSSSQSKSFLAKQRNDINSKSQEKNQKIYAKVNQILLQRGIVFRQKQQKDSQQVLETKNYSKFKGLNKKIIL